MTNRIYPTNFFMGFEDRLIKEVGLGSCTELTVLSAIRVLSDDSREDKAVGASYKEIKLSLNCSHEQLSKSLKSLEQRGLLNRNKDGQDGRVIRYQMTTDAWKLIAESDNFIAQEVMRFLLDGTLPD